MWTPRAYNTAGGWVAPRLPGRILGQCFLAGALALSATPRADPDLPPEFYPEHHQVDALLETNPPPHGVMLLIRNEREDALVELLPRARYYADHLREHLPDVHVAVISYGPELAALSHGRGGAYPGLQAQAVALTGLDYVDVHLCGALAADLNLDASDFPPELDVVPSSTALYQDYALLGYAAIVLQPAW
jgi:intracellular sulfur oxidation DsrE/DsrF family protein